VKPLQRIQQTQGLAEGNRTFGGEVDSFGQHKGTFIITDTNTKPVLFRELEKEASILHFNLPDKGRCQTVSVEADEDLL
jgi:hypothetical protein